jgi:hypothetical protein
MSDVNHVITLGIGTPGDIKHFVLFGLSPSDTSITQAYTANVLANPSPVASVKANPSPAQEVKIG